MKPTFHTPDMPAGILLNVGWLPAMPALQPPPAGLLLAQAAESTPQMPQIVKLLARFFALPAVIQLEMSHVPKNVNLEELRAHHGLA